MPNAANYRQINVSVDPIIAVAFQVACDNRWSLYGECPIRVYAMYSKTLLRKPPPPKADLSTKKKRSKVLAALLDQLVQVMDAQEQSKDNIAENLQGSRVYTSTLCSHDESYAATIDVAQIQTLMYVKRF